MKATFDIPDQIMEEAATYSKATDKNKIIVEALEEYNRRHRVERIISKFGTMESLMTNEEIEALELDEGHY